jgi:hypothetical protein
MIEKEKRRDRFVKRVAVAAWTVTFLIVVLVGIVVGVQVAQMIGSAVSGEMPWSMVLGTAMPFISVLWVATLLIAALSTVGVFLRLRTASLAEIQLRLAALEDMLASRPDAAREPGR